MLVVILLRSLLQAKQCLALTKEANLCEDEQSSVVLSMDTSGNLIASSSNNIVKTDSFLNTTTKSK